MGFMTKFRKLFSILLCAVMLISMLPTGAFAADEGAPDDTAELIEPAETTEPAPSEEPETPENSEDPAPSEDPEAPDDNKEPVEEGTELAARPGPGGSTSIYDHTFRHIDVRIQSAYITFSYIVYDIDGNLDQSASYTDAVECNVTRVEYVVIDGVTYTGFSQSGTYEWRKMSGVSVKVTDASTATIVCDLVSKDGTKTYNDVAINYGFAGIKAAAENCDGYRNGRYDGLDFDVASNSNYTIYLEAVSIAGEKIWNDGNDQDGLRPESITVSLLADGKVIDTKTVTAADEWKYDFGRLPKTDNDGNLINYEIVEEAVEGYTTSFDGNNVINTHTPAVVSLSGSKTWNDNDNQDGIRPASITINLLADGNVVATKTVTAAENWAWSFADLPKFNNGAEIVYTVEEAAVEGYTAAVDGYNITNTHTPEVISIPVTKTWNDANNQDGKRPTSITVHLFADGVDTGKTLTLTGPNWTGSFEGLPKFAGGKEIVYTITEDAVAGYAGSVNGFALTNTHTPETISISGVKTWNDANNQDGKRPESITIRLLANGVEVATRTVTAAENWAWEFVGLYKYQNGALVTYTITEDAVDGYSAVVDGYNVTNSYTPEETSVSVTKSWADNNDQDGIRPNDITVELLADGKPTGKTLVLNEGNGWSGAFTGLDAYKLGQKITYTVAEVAVEGYTTAITGDAATGFIITNTHTTAAVEVSGAKTWNDADNQDGKRPGSITIRLLADGVEVASKTVTEADGWAWSFTGMPKYRDGGTLIIYTVNEDAVEGYTTEYNGTNVINSYTPEETSITVNKSWADNNDQDGIRANDITVELLANGQSTGKILVLNAGNGWTGSFTGLDVYADGVKIAYTVREVSVPGYASSVTGDAATGFTIINSHTPETVSVSGSKTWVDNNDQDGARPASITINLLADGVIVDTKTVTEADGWSWSFENLPKYKDHGTLIVYSITEEAVNGYTAEYNGNNVTNTHAPAKTSVSVVKAWADNNDQDGIRPADITVELLANGKSTGKTLVLSSGNNWTGTFADLDKFAGGEEITYTVKELTVKGYSSVITGNQTAGYTITNSHTPEVVEISGGKTWDDNDNQDGARPESITIKLLSDGVVIDTVTVTEAENWAWSFQNLPKYKDGGVEIVYSITEDAVEGYTTVYDGYNVTNTHAPEKASVSVTKAWSDNNNQDGLRPASITVKLLADGEDTGKTLVLSAENNWTATFTDLDKFAAGAEIVYTVEEVAIDGYTTVITGDMATGYTITNSHTPEVVAISGAKIWDDSNDQDGKRPESITIHLMKNGAVVDTKTVTEADGWAWTFGNLPKFENGEEIVYTISEDAVEGYTTVYDGYDVINTYAPEKINITVNKAWADKNDGDGKRPDSITVHLYANGTRVDTMVITKQDKWVGTFVGLPKYANGVEILYTVTEDAVKDYKTVIRGDAANGFVITNSHTYIPQTGDDRTPNMWLGLMAVSILGIGAVLLPVSKKKRKAE